MSDPTFMPGEQRFEVAVRNVFNDLFAGFCQRNAPPSIKNPPFYRSGLPVYDRNQQFRFWAVIF